MNNHILIIEDDDDDRFLIKSSFEAAGNSPKLVFAETSEGLNEHLNQHRNLPKVIIMDLKMPEKNGIQILQEIRKNPALCSTPVIIYSSETNPDQIKACYQSGANTFIAKPPTFSDMVAVANIIISYWLTVAALP